MAAEDSPATNYPGLLEQASVRQRLDFFRLAGLTDVTIGDALDVEPRSVKRYRAGGTPSPEAFTKIDRMRFTMARLVLEEGLQPEEAGTWMRSISLQPPHEVPITMLDRPQEILALIDARFLDPGIES